MTTPRADLDVIESSCTIRSFVQRKESIAALALIPVTAGMVKTWDAAAEL
jgi:hypothetical protein